MVKDHQNDDERDNRDDYAAEPLPPAWVCCQYAYCGYSNSDVRFVLASHSSSLAALLSTLSFASASLAVSASAFSLPALTRSSRVVTCFCCASKLSEFSNWPFTSSSRSCESASKLLCSSFVRPESSCSVPIVWRSVETFSRME